jgi:hypothetical protein
MRETHDAKFAKKLHGEFQRAKATTGWQRSWNRRCKPQLDSYL